jgi:tetratricopeptide (TPR) repeat protein
MWDREGMWGEISDGRSVRPVTAPTPGERLQNQLTVISASHPYPNWTLLVIASLVLRRSMPRRTPSAVIHREVMRLNSSKTTPTFPSTNELEEVQSLLQSELKDQERFTLLAQQKSLAFIVFGENSREALHTLYSLSRFYNLQNRPESALRHLAKAQQISDGLEPGPESDRIALAIELADAHLQSQRTTKQDRNKHLNATESALEPFVKVMIEDPHLAFCRDLLVARMAARKRNFEVAFQSYDRAVEALSMFNEGVVTAETANLWLEGAAVAEKAKDDSKAGKMYRKAYQTFLTLNIDEAARMIEQKLGADVRVEEGVADVEKQ